MDSPTFPDLIQDTSQIIIHLLDGPTIYRLSFVSKEWHKYCSFYTNTQSTVEIMFKTKNILGIMQNAERLSTQSIYMNLACRTGDLEVINLVFNLLSRHIPIIDIANNGLCGACEIGHLKTAKLMIAKGANNFASAYDHALISNDRDTISFIESKLPPIYQLSGTCNSSRVGGIFRLIVNDGKQDHMIMATHLLNRRILGIWGQQIIGINLIKNQFS